MNKKILTIENFVVYFPILFFALLPRFLFGLSYGKLIDSIIVWLSYFLIPFLVIMLIVRRKEVGSYLRNIGMVIILGSLIIEVNGGFPHGLFVGWPYLNLYLFGLPMIFSGSFIILGTAIDLINVFIKRNEFTITRRIFSIIYLITILGLVILSEPFRYYLAIPVEILRGFFI